MGVFFTMRCTGVMEQAVCRGSSRFRTGLQMNLSGGAAAVKKTTYRTCILALGPLRESIVVANLQANGQSRGDSLARGFPSVFDGQEMHTL